MRDSACHALLFEEEGRLSRSPILVPVLLSSFVMSYSKQQLWERFQKYALELPSLNMSLDISRMNFPESFLKEIRGPMDKAFVAMDALEKGAIANKDENRMVGHYWLRNPSLAPSSSIREEIDSNISAIQQFARDVHSGKTKGPKGAYKNFLLIGIG
jgi:glucose-6-phosphate isomerase